MEQQQPVLDLVDTTMTAIGLAINVVGEALATAFKSSNDVTGGFDAMQKVVINLIKIALTPLQIEFFAIKAAVLAAQLLWEQSFLGDDDPETVQNLTLALAETKQEIVDLGLAAFESGKVIAENFSEAVDEVVTFTKAASEEFAKIDAAALLASARRTTELKKNALILEALNRKALEEFDRLAEQQRIIRDDESKAIEERIEANEELGRVLERQEELMLSNAKAITVAAQAEFQANQTTENRVKLIQAQAEEAAVLATIEGFRAEQIVNRIALDKEVLDIQQSQIDQTTALLLVEEENELRRKEIEIEAFDRRLANIQALGLAENEIFQETVRAKAIAEAEKTKIVADNVKKEIALAKSAANARTQLAVGALTAISDLTNAFAAKDEESQKRAFQINKAASLALATISTIQAAQSAYASQLTIPTPDAPLRAGIAAGIAIASGLARVAAIAATKFESPARPTQQSTASLPSISGGATGDLEQSTPDEVSQFQQQQLFGAATEIISDGIRVMVVESDITQTQKKVETIESTAELGG